jgi:hypothetical protein
MENLGIIKPTSDKITKFKEKWIAYIDYGGGYTENLITLNSQMEMIAWAEEYLECSIDGYYHNGNKVHVKKKIVF